jgi:hypothetical protein
MREFFFCELVVCVGVVGAGTVLDIFEKCFA